MQTTLPIEHLSYSSLRQFCSNPWLFKKNYILGDWEYKQSPTALVGKAFHKYPELLLTGMSREEAIRKAHEAINEVNDKDIDWGKMGSREKCNKELAQVIDFFESEAPDTGQVLSTEYKKTVSPIYEFQKLPLPVKAISDLVAERNGEIIIWDWKVVTTFSDKEAEQPDYIMQSIFNYFTVAETMRPPKAMVFFEIKKTKNSDGTPQTQSYEIIYEEHPEYFRYFLKMYNGVINQLSNPGFQFLPNFSDQFGADESWKDFTSEIMDFSLPVQVSHKPKHLMNTPRQFVESLTDTGADAPQSIEGKIMAKMLEFGIPLDFDTVFAGPNVSLYAFKPSRGVRMTTIEKFDKDLQLALESKSVRILAPIPGKKLVGVEVSNKQQKVVPVETAPQVKGLELPIGVDVYGDPHVLDLAKAPHLLVAGSTGSGKSVAMSVMIQSLIKNNTIDEMGLILIDPKRSEFIEYNDDPHLLSPIITEANDAGETLQWAVDQMEARYKTLMKAKCKNISQYRAEGGAMQSVVIIIDELADLIMGAGVTKGIEGNLIRIAQKARAIGIHLIVATQRPSVDVVTGILKANFPTRLAFMTATQIDSKVILDQGGAEKLIGNGDCLLMRPRYELQRLQGYFTN